MSKYEPLTDYLKAQRGGVVRLSFADIERVIGKKLPDSAGAHRAWWSNNPLNNVMTRAWLDAGFESEQVDLPGRKLVFRRVDGENSQRESLEESASRLTQSLEPSPSSKSALFGWLSGTVTIPSGVDLTEPADGEWALLTAHDEPAA